MGRETHRGRGDRGVLEPPFLGWQWDRLFWRAPSARRAPEQLGWGQQLRQRMQEPPESSPITPIRGCSNPQRMQEPPQITPEDTQTTHPHPETPGPHLAAAPRLSAHLS